jgi:pimeloyl-ACP methyl ester carboxylesterase
MRRLLKVLVPLAGVLAVVVAVNAVVTSRETKPARSFHGGRVVAVPGGKLNVREDGERGRPPVVLLHCLACALNWWDAVTPALGRDHHVVRIDLLGHGGSAKPRADYTPQENARLVAQVIARLGLENPVIVGHSLGGIVATALAERRDVQLAGIALMGDPPAFRFREFPLTGRMATWPVVGQTFWRTATDGMVKSGLQEAFAPGYHVPERFVDDARRMTYTSYSRSNDRATDFMKKSGLAARLNRTRVPLLVIQGKRDQIALPSGAREWRKVPGARVVELAGAGHSPNVERPLQTASLLLEFAAALQSGARAR